MLFRVPTQTALLRPMALIAALALGGCSMAGFPGVIPAPATKPVAAASPAPTPVERSQLATVAIGDVGLAPLAFVSEPVASPARSAVGASVGVNALISKYAALYGIPESLLHRVVRSESGYNPAARNGPYYGLMQILPQTARTMGYGGPAEGLLDAETNLKFGAKYLRGAYLVANADPERAIGLYRSGYYYHAKRAGLLEAAGLN